MKADEKQPTCLGTVPGASEEQTEMYLTYIEGVPQLATPHSAKSLRGVSCSAGEQAEVPGRL